MCVCVCVCVSGLADFFRDFVDDVKTLDSEALQRVPHWFHDDVPVCDWEGITADSKGRITEIDVSFSNSSRCCAQSLQVYIDHPYCTRSVCPC